LAQTLLLSWQCRQEAVDAGHGAMAEVGTSTMVNGVIIGNHGDRRQFTRANIENMNVSLWSMLLIENQNKSLMGILLTKNVCLWSMLLIENMNKSLIRMLPTKRLFETQTLLAAFQH
jgi:hypothetical protein